MQDLLKQDLVFHTRKPKADIGSKQISHFNRSSALRITRLIDQTMIGHFIKIGTQVIPGSTPRCQLVQKLRKHVPNHMICQHTITAQAQRILVKSKRIKVKDLDQCLLIHPSCSVQKYAISFHGNKRNPVNGFRKEQNKCGDVVLTVVIVALILEMPPWWRAQVYLQIHYSTDDKR